MSITLRTGPSMRSASLSLPAKSPQAWDLRLVHRVDDFFRAVTETGPLLASAVAAPAYLLARNGVLAGFLRAAPSLWTRGAVVRATAAAAALPFEVLAFSGTTLAYRAVTQGAPHPASLTDFFREWGSLGLGFGLFKIHGRLAQGLFGGPLAGAVGMYSGLVHAHLWEHLLGWNRISNGTELLLQSGETFWQLRTMGHLSQGLLGRRYAAWMETLDAKAGREAPGLPWARPLFATPEGNVFAMRFWKPKQPKPGKNVPPSERPTPIEKLPETKRSAEPDPDISAGPTPLIPPPPSTPPPSGHSLTPIPRVPPEPLIIYGEPRTPRPSGIPLPRNKRMKEKLEETPQGNLLSSPQALAWEPKIVGPEMGTDTWVFYNAFWHFNMPVYPSHDASQYQSQASLGKEPSRVPLIAKRASSGLVKEHAVIVRFGPTKESGFAIHAHHGDVTIKRVMESFYLKRGENGGYGQRIWLNNGDIVQLTPDIEFIFAPR